MTLKTTHKPVVALPYNFELHDIVMMALQNHPSDELYRRTMDHFECLYAESVERPKFLSIAMHPFLVGLAAPDRSCAARVRGHAEPAGRRRMGRRADPRLVQGSGRRQGVSAGRSGSFYVPHDIAAPVGGGGRGAARRAERGRQGYVRYCRHENGRRQSRMACGADAGEPARDGGAEARRCRCDDHGQDDSAKSCSIQWWATTRTTACPPT